MLQLTNQNDDGVTIDPNRVSFTTDSSFGLNLDESITLLHKTGGSKTLNLNGYGEAYERLDGVPDGQPVKEFWLYTSDEKDKLNARYDAKNLYGEGGDNRKGQRVKGNTLTIGAGEIASNAYGGRVDSGDVTENEVKMSGGEINIYVYGGRSEKGSATGNTVTISDGTVKASVLGGFLPQSAKKAMMNRYRLTAFLIFPIIFKFNARSNRNATGIRDRNFLRRHITWLPVVRAREGLRNLRLISRGAEDIFKRNDARKICDSRTNRTYRNNSGDCNKCFFVFHFWPCLFL